jgi:hypothetical protein
MYSKNRPVRPGCNEKEGLIDRVAIYLGLERVAKAQGGCNYDTCNGCYIKVVGGFCGNGCEGTYWQNYSGGMCNGGSPSLVPPVVPIRVAVAIVHPVRRRVAGVNYG